MLERICRAIYCTTVYDHCLLAREGPASQDYESADANIAVKNATPRQDRLPLAVILKLKIERFGVTESVENKNDLVVNKYEAVLTINKTNPVTPVINVTESDKNESVLIKIVWFIYPLGNGFCVRYLISKSKHIRDSKHDIIAPPPRKQYLPPSSPVLPLWVRYAYELPD